jgi:hypothetical protein
MLDEIKGKLPENIPKITPQKNIFLPKTPPP